MAGTNDIFNRTELLVGEDTMALYRSVKVILFGVGGVGSWCAEGLIRSGIGHLTIVDADVVDITNINRQLMATTATVGRPKVEVLRERLLGINPEADIVARRECFCADTAEQFDIKSYDYVIDAIDSLANKMELILLCTKKNELWSEISGHRPMPKLFSSMGAALKMDPTQVRVSEFWEVDGCPLAAMLRRRMRRQKRFPGRKFKCVWSPEVLPNKGTVVSEEKDGALFHKAQINGTMVHITAIMGFYLSALLLMDVSNSAK